MAYITVELELQNINRETKKFVIGPFRQNSAAISNIKQKIKTFNTIQSEQAAWYDYIGINGQTLLMQGVYPNVPIINAAIITANEQELNLYES